MLRSHWVMSSCICATMVFAPSAFADDSKPSFDCSDKLSATEKTICDSPELAQLDEQLGKAYQNALSNAPEPDLLKKGQKVFLATRNACNSDASCIGSAYRNRAATLSSPAPQRTVDNTKVPAQALGSDNAIPFVFDNALDGFAVSGTWFPLDTASDRTVLSGPAVFQLKDSKAGKTIKVAENAVSILNDAYLKDHQIDPGKLAGGLGQLITTLKSDAPIHLNYGQADRAQKVSCEDSKDSCLKLGEIPIDLQDLNFDGTPEIVITQRGMAQRFVDAYRVFTLDPDGEGQFGTLPYDDNEYQKVFGQIDSLTTINLTKKQIRIFSSNGGCTNSAEIYGVGKESGLIQIGYEVWQEIDGQCVDKLYQVNTSDSGVSTFKMISSRKE